MRLSDEEMEATAGWSFALSPEMLDGGGPGTVFTVEMDTRRGDAALTNEATGETRLFPLKVSAPPGI